MERQDRIQICNKFLYDLGQKYRSMEERHVLLGDIDKARKLSETTANLLFLEVFIDDLNHKISTLEVENDLLRIRVKDLERKK